jgi:DNA (cytosine-5)-methyltransferase 1
VATIFSGIGAPEAALGKRHEIVFGCEIDKFARQTYLANHSCSILYENVWNIPHNCPDFDLLVFGFPCQSYSMLGKRLGFQDERGAILFPCLDILKAKQPRYFIAENVKGLLYHEKGETMKTIVENMTECGYRVFYQVLNSRCFGVPQNRERVFFVGIRNDLELAFSFPLPPVTTITLRDILEQSVDRKYYLSSALKDWYNRNAPFRIKKRYTNIDRQFAQCLVSSCIRATNWITDDFRFENVKIPLLEPDTPIRRLTPRECARLHGFDDSFIIPVSDSQAYKQFGNTMTVPVLAALFAQLGM